MNTYTHYKASHSATICLFVCIVLGFPSSWCWNLSWSANKLIRNHALGLGLDIYFFELCPINSLEAKNEINYLYPMIFFFKTNLTMKLTSEAPKFSK